jgi:hypothetical protein
MKKILFEFSDLHTSKFEKTFPDFLHPKYPFQHHLK